MKITGLVSGRPEEKCLSRELSKQPATDDAALKILAVSKTLVNAIEGQGEFNGPV